MHSTHFLTKVTVLYSTAMTGLGQCIVIMSPFLICHTICHLRKLKKFFNTYFANVFLKNIPILLFKVVMVWPNCELPTVLQK